MSDLVIVQRLVLVTLIAGVIGFERERHGRAAGFRTHILVGIGSCLVMLTGLYLMEAFAGQVQIDPTRIAAQVVSGMGFLGAGTILRFRASVRGLTTAASLWAVGGVGIAVGAGFVTAAVLSGLIVVLVLWGFSPLERAMRTTWYQTLVVETTSTGPELARIRALLHDYGLEVRDVDIKDGHASDRVHLEFQVKLSPDHPKDDLVQALRRLEHITKAHWV